MRDKQCSYILSILFVFGLIIFIGISCGGGGGDSSSGGGNNNVADTGDNGDDSDGTTDDDESDGTTDDDDSDGTTDGGDTGGNTLPSADAGLDQVVTEGETVRLDGFGSADADNDTLTYTWTFALLPEGSTAQLSDSTAVDPQFTADIAGTYIVSLVVNDGTGNSNPDMVEIVALVPVSFTTRIQPIFNNNCTSSCHESGGSASFLLLSPTDSYDALVDQSSTMTTNGGLLVESGNFADSVLYQRVSSEGLDASEDRMPQGGDALQGSEQNLIRRWIGEGARAN